MCTHTRALWPQALTKVTLAGSQEGAVPITEQTRGATLAPEVSPFVSGEPEATLRCRAVSACDGPVGGGRGGTFVGMGIWEGPSFRTAG